jgi:hypothetical protein
MQAPSATQKHNQTLIMHDEMVGAIHDRLMDDNQLDVAHAFNEACVEIAELYKEIDRLEGRVSSGFVRKKKK